MHEASRRGDGPASDRPHRAGCGRIDRDPEPLTVTRCEEAAGRFWIAGAPLRRIRRRALVHAGVAWSCARLTRSIGNAWIAATLVPPGATLKAMHAMTMAGAGR